jgi:hypothetical protein
MTGAVVYRLNRHRDVSGVSGEGDEKATVVEFSSGLSVLHWNSDKPSIQVHTDIRHIIDHHGHGGASELVLYENERLIKAYAQVCFFLSHQMIPDRLPLSVGPHPEWPDRLLVKVRPAAFSFWVVLLDGSVSACSHEEVGGQIITTWVSPDGGLWVQSFENAMPADLFQPYPNNDAHDPRD